MPEELVLFEDFTLNRSACELRRRGTVIPLQRIPFELLWLLAERRGQVVTREEILERVWGKGVFVDIESAINTAVRKVRRALGDDPEGPRFILTVPARGYRFVAQTRRPKAVGAGHFRARGLDAMVGRERELSSLMSGLGETLAGRGRTVFLVSGEPGIGKTRLADEFAAAAEAKGLAVRIGHCFQEAVPFLPFVEMLERFVDGIGEPEQLRRQLADEASELARLLPKLKRILPDLPPALDLPPLQARRHLFNCFFDFVSRIATDQPTLMVVEDLHWADDSTLALLDHLAQRIPDLPLMLLGTYRDAEIDVTGGLAKTLEDLLRGRLATRLKLKGLPRDDVATMLSRLSGKSAPAGVVEEIFAETDGNPFFVEELFRHLNEENRLYNSAGEFHSSLKIAELEVPESVRLVVARRLERLDETTRKMLATAATIGRFFSFELLEAASGTDRDSLMECIEEAERAGLVYSLSEGPKARFQFSHELVRQAVISRLSSALRQNLHLDVADAIERIFSDTLEDYWGELAFHYNCSTNARKAVEYLGRAAAQAARRTAHNQAVSYVTNAIERLREWPDETERTQQEIALQLTMGPALMATLGQSAPEAEKAYSRAYELCREVDDQPQLFRVMSGLWGVYQVQAKFESAHELGQKLLPLAEKLRYPLFLLGAHEALGTTLLWLGEFVSARDHLEQASSFYILKERRAKSFRATQDPGVDCLSFTALTLWYLGYPDQACTKIERAVALARELAHPYTLGYAFTHAALVYQLCRREQATRESAEAAIEICSKHGFPFFLGVATLIRGWALAQEGKREEGIEEILRGFGIYRTTGSQINWPEYFIALAESYAVLGKVDEAVKAVEEALTAVERTGERRDEAEVHRLKGVLALRQTVSRLKTQSKLSAEQQFRKAIEVARNQRAKSWELRATTSLARLLRDTSRRDEARAMLAEIYGWFTEGFETSDMKDARVLLHELSHPPSRRP
jgi:DNA-binding winged helix-turn-helix (wHTH) protein/predicted ATPase